MQVLTPDIATIRMDFPILDRIVNGHVLAYLDNAASSQMPSVVMEAYADYHRRYHANVHRGVHTLSQEATDAYENARDEVMAFIGAAFREEIVFTTGTTDSINLVAASWGGTFLGEGDRILVSNLEHHANIVPWVRLAETKGARIEVIPITDSGEINMDAYVRLLPGAKLVAVNHVSNALGTINPIAEIVRLAKAEGAVTMVDGAQAVPHMAVDVQTIGCDFYAFSTHKICGPTGFGVLYGRKSLLESMPPYRSGGDMILSVSFDRIVYNKVPFLFEAGTPPIAQGIQTGAAIRYLNGIGMDVIAELEHRLLTYATEALSDIDGLRIIGTAADKAAVISFVLDGIHPHDVGTILDEDGIAVRTGHHCAQPVMERYGIPATTRASFAFYNTTGEIERLAASIRRTIQLLR
jgi:cysteine desulfurase / selenocysteine lyase